MTVREVPGPCPNCRGLMPVLKSIERQGYTLAHGTFRVREFVHACAAGCHHPSGHRVTRRAQELSELIIPGCSVGYDVMTWVGMERYLHYRQREEIRESLLSEHGILLSTGTISGLARRFGTYLRTLHEAQAGELRAALDRDGGYPLHIDATGESGRGTLLIAYAGWRQWVLGAWKIPTERADAILPRLREVVSHFGPPIAIVRDLGRAMIPAAHDLVAELEEPIPILSCHAHFLADVGKDLLKDSHGQLRKLFRDHRVRPGLRSLVREIGRKLGGDIDQVRGAVQGWQALQDDEHSLPQGNRNGLGVVRTLAQWVLDYPTDSTDADFPFDRPYLDLLDRCVRVRRAVDAFLRKPPEDKEVNRALRRLARLLEPPSSQHAFLNATTTLRRRAGLFDELRTALRLHPSTDADTREPTPETAQRELQDVQTAVESLYLSLQERRPQRGPAQDSRQAIDLILMHLDRYGDSLWGHVIKLSAEAGGGIRLVERTNNLLEGFNRSMKQGERRRSGRKTLSDDFEHLPPEAALARNLLCADYVEILCGSIEQLPKAFAQLDADRRRQSLATEPPNASQPTQHTPEIASASLPKEDRRLIRSEDMAIRILAAARSRAPRAEIRPAQH